jgi:hypothetical protein
MVCRGIGGDSLVWSRIGYVAITILPPVGLHMLVHITGMKQRWAIWPGYLAGAAFVAFFSLAGHSIEGHACLGNYVIFQVAPGYGGLYGVYYYGLLLAILALGWYHLRKPYPKRLKKAVTGLMAAYAVFIIPSTGAGLASPSAIAAMPPIMCGFAVLLAFIIVFTVVPRTAERKK